MFDDPRWGDDPRDRDLDPRDVFPLAAGVFYPLTGWLLSPDVAAFSMSGSTLIVVANALLLKRVKMSEPSRRALSR